MNTRKVVGIFLFCLTCVTCGVFPTIVVLVGCAFVIGFVRWIASKVS